MRRSFHLICALLLAVAATIAVSSTPSAAQRIPAKQPTVFTEEMTWEEVRDALKAGKTTVIIPTGGVEQNGPYVVTGKHNYIVRATAEAIARKLGNALVAPSCRLSPKGESPRRPST